MSTSTTFHNWLIAVPALIFSTTEIFPAKPVYIQGKIVQKSTGRAIENAYVYIVSGEEEALTEKDGSFKVTTWQDLPVTLIIEHPHYKVQKIKVSDSTQTRLILLEPK